MPLPESKLKGADWLRPLAWPEYFSVAEQSVARVKLQSVLGHTAAELEAERRERLSEPAQNVTEGTGSEVED
jgi:hypothetical protein